MIQKFPYIVNKVKKSRNKTYAVIIDEAHSSTAGKNMAAVTITLSNGTEVSYDTEDMIIDEISRHGKQSNVSMFAFTATPKATTLQLFGREKANGQKGAFHLYHWSFIPFTGDQRPSTLYSSSGGLSVPGTVFSTEKPAQGSGVLSGDGELSGETEGSGDEDRPGTGREREESEIPVVFRMCPVHSTNVNRKAQTISSVSRRKRERICFIQ